jgi:effector-binding domain-containing protein
MDRKNVSDQEIVLKDLPQRKVVYLLCKGPWRQLPALLRSLSEYASRSGIKTIGPPSGFYYNTPLEVGVDDLTWEVCYPVGSNVPDYADDQAKSGVRGIPATRVAVIVHQGSYRKASLSYEELQTWIEMRRLRVSGPAEELYLTDIGKTNEEQRIEIRLPVSAA